MYDEKYAQIDQENLYRVIADMPNQLTDGLKLSQDLVISGDFEYLVLSGMGGSALSAELLKIYLDETINKERKGNPIRVVINRGYALPMEAFSSKCLNVLSSYSGNTEETLSSFQEVLNNKLPALVISSGGKLTEMAKANNIPSILLLGGIQPRMGVGCSFGALMGVLTKLGILADKTADLKTAKTEIIKNLEIFENKGKEVVSYIHGQTPIIYASERLKSIAMIWKIMFNENSKTPAFWNFFPELNHNEMVGFNNPQANFSLIILRDEMDHPRNLKRFQMTDSLLKNYGLKVAFVDAPTGEMIFKIFALLQIGCFASYHLALAYEIDPTPVHMVERFKGLLE